nr:O-antigen ligase family protein [Deltaproteobacteria bacterium]
VLSLYLIIQYHLNIKKSIKAVKKNIFLLGLYFSFFLSCLWSYNPKNTLSSSFWASIFLGCYFIFYFAAKKYDFKKLDMIYIILPVFLSILNIIFLIKYGRLRGDGSYSNHMAAMVEVAIPFLLYKIRIDYKNKMIWVALFLTVFSLIISESRGSYLILLCSFFIVPFFWGRSFKHLVKYFVYSLIVLSLTIFVLFNFPYVEKYINNVSKRIDKSYSQFNLGKVFSSGKITKVRRDGITKRMIQYHMGINTIRHHPFIGIGYDSYRQYMKEEYHLAKGKAKISHNVFFTVWTSSGLLGMFCLMGVLFSAFNNLKKEYFYYKELNREYTYWIMANFFALLILLLHGQFRPLLTNVMFYLPLAAAVAMGADEENNQREGKREARTVQYWNQIEKK